IIETVNVGTVVTLLQACPTVVNGINWYNVSVAGKAGWMRFDHLQAAVSPATFPSVLKCSGQHLVDTNGFVMPQMRGFTVRAYNSAEPFRAQEFVDMYNKGARIVRVMVYWDQLEPAAGAIETTWVANFLDVTVARAVDAGLYVWFGFYFGPQGIHMPAWA